jgi:hypothetical protein
MVIGQNNDRFDNRWVNARAMKYDLEVNTFVRSFDIMKELKGCLDYLVILWLISLSF